MLPGKQKGRRDPALSGQHFPTCHVQRHRPLGPQCCDRASLAARAPAPSPPSPQLGNRGSAGGPAQAGRQVSVLLAVTCGQVVTCLRRDLKRGTGKERQNPDPFPSVCTPSSSSHPSPSSFLCPHALRVQRAKRPDDGVTPKRMCCGGQQSLCRGPGAHTRAHVG